MILDEAIAAGIDLMEELAREGRMDEYHKVRLLIEAGKWIEICRREMHGVYPRLLPCETQK